MSAPADAKALARAIDHTLLKPEATAEQVRRLVEEAAEHAFASVCIPPVYVPLAAGLLAGSGVHVGTVVAFPLGYAHPAVRVEEARRAVGDGACELDTVINLSWLKGGEDARALADLTGWAETLRREAEGLTLKVIVETGLLTREEKLRAVEVVAACGADFVKTSTGFGPGGATAEDVALLARAARGRVAVKASGGIRDAAAALALLAAGAARLGTSAGVAILEQAREAGFRSGAR